MKVLVWPADDAGCGNNRLIWPARALQAQGADIRIDTTGPTVLWDREWHGVAPPEDAQVCGVRRPDADVVVMQRPGRWHWSPIIEALQGHGVRVIVDVDDDFAAIPRENAAAAAYDPRLSSFHNREWVARACELADLVTVTTPALAARYAGHGRVAVLPNLVPESYLSVEVERDRLLLGWTGSVETHPHDLEVTGGGVHRALTVVRDAQFGVVGTGVGVSERLGCRVDRTTGWLPIEEYPSALAGLDVGIVPLHDSTFNRAKSALKMCEMAALGVVPVVSPTPDNLRMVEAGIGVVAGSPQQWKKRLVRLLSSADLRAEMAARGRKVMAGQTYEGNCGRWLEAWASPLQRSVAA